MNGDIRAKPMPIGAKSFVSIWLCTVACVFLAASGQAMAKPKGKPEAKPRSSSSDSSVSQSANKAQSQVADDNDGVRVEGKKAKVLTFGALDVEGKMRTPQLLFFLNRVKAELDSTTPLRRSFINELNATAKEKGL